MIWPILQINSLKLARPKATLGLHTVEQLQTSSTDCSTDDEINQIEESSDGDLTPEKTNTKATPEKKRKVSFN